MGVVVLPKSLTAKTEAKAADVMADFQAIVDEVNGKLDLENFAESLRNALIPTGTVLATARSAAPTGFLLCQGQAVSRTTYAVLFAAIGTTFGVGDGVTTFNLPDLRGRVPVGPDASTGRLFSSGALGQAAGHSRLQAHTHTDGGTMSTGTESVFHQHTRQMVPFARHEGGGLEFTSWDYSAEIAWKSTNQNALHIHAVTGTTSSTGLGNGENMPPYQCVNWMIKV